MSDNFERQCTRRPAQSDPVIDHAIVNMDPPLGAGSGGGPDFTTTPGGHGVEYKDGNGGIHATQLLFTATGASGDLACQPVVTIVAGDGQSMDGRVEAHGSHGVRLSTGPPKFPPASSPNFNGIQLQVSETQQISLRRGLLPTDNEIQLNPGFLVVDGGAGAILINSDTSIKISVANGLSSIILTPAGITITGLITQINP